MIILCDGCGKKFDNDSLICPNCGEAHMEIERIDEQEVYEDVSDWAWADTDILLEQDFH